MKTNTLIIQINKSKEDVFKFTTTPPNSTLWIPSIIDEITSEWPIRIGAIYTLTDTSGEESEVKVCALKKYDYVEWESMDKNYHCRYTFKEIDKNKSALEYHEWVDNGEIENPFTIEILEKLKKVLEK